MDEEEIAKIQGEPYADPSSPSQVMTLDKGRIGSSYRVVRLELPQRVEKRLEALGMTEGTKIDILNNKNEGALIIKVRGTRLAVGKGISVNIYVRS